MVTHLFTDLRLSRCGRGVTQRNGHLLSIWPLTGLEGLLGSACATPALRERPNSVSSCEVSGDVLVQARLRRQPGPNPVERCGGNRMAKRRPDLGRPRVSSRMRLGVRARSRSQSQIPAPPPITFIRASSNSVHGSAVGVGRNEFTY